MSPHCWTRSKALLWLWLTSRTCMHHLQEPDITEAVRGAHILIFVVPHQVWSFFSFTCTCALVTFWTLKPFWGLGPLGSLEASSRQVSPRNIMGWHAAASPLRTPHYVYNWRDVRCNVRTSQFIGGLCDKIRGNTAEDCVGVSLIKGLHFENNSLILISDMISKVKQCLLRACTHLARKCVISKSTAGRHAKSSKSNKLAVRRDSIWKHNTLQDLGHCGAQLIRHVLWAMAGAWWHGHISPHGGK